MRSGLIFQVLHCALSPIDHGEHLCPTLKPLISCVKQPLRFLCLDEKLEGCDFNAESQDTVVLRKIIENLGLAFNHFANVVFN